MQTKEFKQRAAPKRESKFGPSETTRCGVCGKSVYAAEQIKANNQMYHKTCLKCKTCAPTPPNERRALKRRLATDVADGTQA